MLSARFLYGFNLYVYIEVLEMKIKIRLRVVIALMVSVFTGAAYGHAITMGYENAGNAGAIDFWMGSYHAGNPLPFEGSLTLTGVNGTNYAANTATFNTFTNAKPSGLVDGTNNFYAASGHGSSSTAVDDGTYWSVNQSGNPIVSWQGASFTGLAAGDYDFEYDCVGCNMNWDVWNQGLVAEFTISKAVVSGASQVSEPSIIALFTAGLFGLGLIRRRKDQS
jgi:hypothetical protein